MEGSIVSMIEESCFVSRLGDFVLSHHPQRRKSVETDKALSWR